MTRKNIIFKVRGKILSKGMKVNDFHYPDLSISINPDTAVSLPKVKTASFTIQSQDDIQRLTDLLLDGYCSNTEVIRLFIEDEQYMNSVLQSFGYVCLENLTRIIIYSICILEVYYY